MKRTTTLLALLAAALVQGGCANSGTFLAGNLTAVELSEPNYKIVATGVSGQSRAAYAIGVSYADGPRTGSLSLFRLSGTGQLYKEAMEDLWAAFEAEHGTAAGRRLALANVRYDADTTNLLLYCDVTLSIRADVVEFSE